MGRECPGLAETWRNPRFHSGSDLHHSRADSRKCSKVVLGGGGGASEFSLKSVLDSTTRFFSGKHEERRINKRNLGGESMMFPSPSDSVPSPRASPAKGIVYASRAPW